MSDRTKFQIPEGENVTIKFLDASPIAYHSDLTVEDLERYRKRLLHHQHENDCPLCKAGIPLSKNRGS